MPGTSTVPAGRHPFNRCQISNGNAYFLGRVDQRTLLGRRHVDLFEDYCSDMGGFEHVSTARRELARRAAAVGAWCDLQEAALARDEDVDLDKYLSAVDRHRRLLQLMGLERRSRDVTPSIDQYVAEKRGAA